MDEIRVFLAVSIFCISSYLAYDLIINGFNFWVLMACILGYILTHYVLPRRYDTGDLCEELLDSESHWYDFLERLIDIPYQSMAFLLRSIGRIVSSVGDID